MNVDYEEEDPAIVAQREYVRELERRAKNIRYGKPPVRANGISIGQVYRFRPCFRYKNDFKQCGELLVEMMNHKDAYWFNEPVDWLTLAIPQYPKIVTNPMDFGTVKGKLEHNLYATVDDFDNDVGLVWYNGLKFNKKGTAVFKATEDLREWYIKRMEWYFNRHADEDDNIEPEVMQAVRGRYKLSIHLPPDNPHKGNGSEFTPPPSGSDYPSQSPRGVYGASTLSTIHHPHPPPSEQPDTKRRRNNSPFPAGSPARPIPHIVSPHPAGNQSGFRISPLPIDHMTGRAQQFPRGSVEQLLQDFIALDDENRKRAVAEICKDHVYQRANATESTDATATEFDFAQLSDVTLWNIKRIVDSRGGSDRTDNLIVHHKQSLYQNGNVSSHLTQAPQSNGAWHGSPAASSNGSSNAFSNGSSNAFSNGSSNAFSNGTSNAFSNGSSNGSSNASSNAFSNGSSNAFSNGSSNAFSNGSSNAFSNPTRDPRKTREALDGEAHKLLYGYEEHENVNSSSKRGTSKPSPSPRNQKPVTPFVVSRKPLAPTPRRFAPAPPQTHRPVVNGHKRLDATPAPRIIARANIDSDSDSDTSESEIEDSDSDGDAGIQHFAPQ